MPKVKLFNCPSCGSALIPQGDAVEIMCQYGWVGEYLFTDKNEIYLVAGRNMIYKIC